MPKTCDQCAWTRINGMFCHETGCPNASKVWNGERWIFTNDEDDYFDDCTDICHSADDGYYDEIRLEQNEDE